MTIDGASPAPAAVAILSSYRTEPCRGLSDKHCHDLWLAAPALPAAGAGGGAGPRPQHRLLLALRDLHTRGEVEAAQSEVLCPAVDSRRNLPRQGRSNVVSIFNTLQIRKTCLGNVITITADWDAGRGEGVRRPVQPSLCQAGPAVGAELPAVRHILGPRQSKQGTTKTATEFTDDLLNT